MIIKDSMIAEKKTVGKNSEGNPVVMVLTHGGLYAFFSKKGNEIETLGMAPHKAIAAWMSEKKDKGIKWTEGFLKSENNEYEDLRKSEKKLVQRLRNILFSQYTNLQKSEEFKDYYIFYDTHTMNIGISHREDLKRELLAKNIDKFCVIRRIDLSEPPTIIAYHDDFAKIVYCKE